MTRRGTPTEALLACAAAALVAHLSLMWWVPIPLWANLIVTALLAVVVFHCVRRWYYRDGA